MVIEQASTIQRDLITPVPHEPVVIVGTGPVGIRCAYELLKRGDSTTVAMYGGEPWEPYDRVGLSAVLSGDIDWQSIDNQSITASANRFVRYDNCPVICVDNERKIVIDCAFNELRYSKLVLATGSSAHIPNIPGVSLPGVYTFRDRNDVRALLARRARSRRTVVLGGGLLGLEAARAMQRQNTEVTLIEHSSRLMFRQLDDAAATLLRETILKLGIKVILGDGVRKFIGDHVVNGLQLQSGRIVHCDTVILATGIRPNIELARDLKLNVGSGIRVNDHMQTSDPDIYAVGECAEHRGKVYGIVTPGIEQSAVAAHHITGGHSSYNGSINATRLKVVGESVFSCGEADTEQDRPALRKNYVYMQPDKHLYRKIVIENGRLTGVIAIGDWPESVRLQELVKNRQRIWPWQTSRFLKQGNIFRQNSNNSVGAWPSTAVVCSCKAISRGMLSDQIDAGCNSVTKLMHQTGASTVCGSCRPLLSELVGEVVVEKPGSLSRPLMTASVLALIATLIIFALGPIPYTQSAQFQFPYDEIWRNGLVRQISGFSLLGITLILLILPLRKRIKNFTFGSYINWRLAHAVLGILLVVTLVGHTGMRMGENLNLALISTYMAILVFGAIAGISAYAETLLAARTGKTLRALSNKMHLYAFFPAPILLIFHVLSVYYF